MALIQRGQSHILNDELIFDNWEIKENQLTNALEINNNAVNMMEFEDTGDINIITNLNITGNENINGNLNITGNLIVSGDITGDISVNTIADTDNTTSITTEATAETLIFTTNSTERMTLTSAGIMTLNSGSFNSDASSLFFGVGLSQVARLNGDALYLESGVLALSNNLSGAIVDTDGTDIRLSPNTSNVGALTIDTNGLVGMGGNVAPTYQLDILGTDIRLDSNTSGTARIRLDTLATTGGVIARSNAGNVSIGDLDSNGGQCLFYADGSLMGRFNTSGLGIAVDPTISFAIEDANTGIHSLSTDILSLVSNGSGNRALTWTPERNIIIGDRDIYSNSEITSLTEALIFSEANSYGKDKYLFTLWEDGSNTHQIGYEFDYYTGSGGSTTSHSRINIISNGTNDEAINGANENFTASFLSNGNCMFYGSNGSSVLTPQLTITLGDTDTGIDWISDGEFIIQNNSTETMRFNSNNNVGIGWNSNPNAKCHIYDATSEVCRLESDNISLSANLLVCKAKSVNRCIIAGDGDITNVNDSYGVLSDVRIKENIVDCNSQWEDIKGIRFVNYNLINTPETTQLGVIADELELVCPGLVKTTTNSQEVNGELIENIKVVKSSVLRMKGIVALQEAMERIETLEKKMLKVLTQNKYLVNELEELKKLN